MRYDHIQLLRPMNETFKKRKDKTCKKKNKVRLQLILKISSQNCTLTLCFILQMWHFYDSAIM